MDSVLFQLKTEIKSYPYQAKYDSFITKRNNWIEAEREENPLAFISFTTPKSKFYAVTDEGTELSIHEYLVQSKKEYSDSIDCVIEVTVQWDGIITRASVVRYKNLKPDFVKLREVIMKIRAKPALNSAGFPEPGPMRYHIPFSTTGYKKK